MTDRPIIFSGPMVQALLAGSKTQTRRLIEPFTGPTREGDHMVSWPADAFVRTCAKFRPRYRRGDRLYVRESWRVSPEACEGWHPEHCRGWIDYQAGGSLEVVAPSFDAVEKATFLTTESLDWDFIPSRYRPSIHMPRWASRLTLIVEDIRIERLQSISEADIYAEGAITEEWQEWREDVTNIGMPSGSRIESERDVWQRLWVSLHGEDSWDADPWVVAVTFRVELGNIDQVPA